MQAKRLFEMLPERVGWRQEPTAARGSRLEARPVRGDGVLLQSHERRTGVVVPPSANVRLNEIGSHDATTPYSPTTRLIPSKDGVRGGPRRLQCVPRP